MTKVLDIQRWLDQVAPGHLAASWDNTGLLLGDPDRSVHQAMTCLSLTMDVAREAVDRKIDLIITHHPIPFKPIKNLSTASPEGRILWLLASNGISVFSPHTRWDDSSAGINHCLAEMVGLLGVTPLESARAPSEVKLVTFVPQGHLEQVRSALFAAGAGGIGNYSECSFHVSGTGTFLGNSDSNPVIGSRGAREQVPEERLEVVCPAGKLDQIVAGLRSSHPYEEPAFDLVSLINKPLRQGTGLIGSTSEPMLLGKMLDKWKDGLKLQSLQWVGDPCKRVSRVAVVCGSGGSLLGKALAMGADCFVTGEMRFHDALAVRDANCCAVLLGHYASERFSMENLAQRLAGEFPLVVSHASEAEADPIQTWALAENR